MRSLILLVLFICFTYEVNAQNFQQITVAEAKVLIAENENNPIFTILDVRTPAEYESGHIEGAHLRDFYDLDFEEQLDSLHKDRVYLVYCQAGFRSGLSYEMLQELGFNTVYDMLGGMNAWNADNCPTTTVPTPFEDLTVLPTTSVCSNQGIFSLKLKVLLEGAFDGSEMATNLDDNGILPNTQSYNTAPFNYSGSEIKNTDLPVVDWIGVCLRNTPEDAVSCQAALLLADGTIVNTNGEECIAFDQVGAFFDYYVSIHHRGHISLISAEKVSKDAFYDFTSDIGQAAGIEPMKNINGQWVMFGGDYDNNGIINNVDFNLWSQDGASVNQYIVVDGDGNGIVNNLDFNIWELNRSKVGSPDLGNDMN